MIAGHLRRDLRRAAARSAILFTLSFCLGLLLAGFDPRMVASTFTASLIPFPLSLLELHRARLPARRRGGVVILIWCVAVIACLLGAAQTIYSDAGGLEGLGAAWVDSQTILQPAVLFSFGILATLYTLAAIGRVPEEVSPVTASLKWTAILGLPLLLLGGCGAFVGVLVVVGVLGAAYNLGDWAEAKLWAWTHRAEAAAIRKLGLPWTRRWTLAYLNHAPARGALGARAPVPSADLPTWITELAHAGEAARHEAALALLLLAVPLWEDAHAGEQTARDLLDQLVEYMRKPTDAGRTATRAASAAWRTGDWEAAVGFEAASAITAEAKWGGSTAPLAVTRAALLIDEHCGEGTARRAISEALIAWALEPSDPGTDSETDPALPIA